MKLHGNAFDLTGRIIGQLTVVELVGNCKRGNWWRCLCTCGNESYTATSGDLRSGRINSCGCYKKSEDYAAINTTHGQRRANEGHKPSRAYRSWSEMKRRCNDTTRQNYKYYGGKGITYDPAWEDFEAFYADMGHYPFGHELDRRDSKLGYYKDNCRWLTKADNIKNRDGGLP